MRRRSWGGSTLAMSWPSTTMRPLEASIIRLIMRRVVVLPQPDGPTRTVRSPSGTSRARSSTAVVPSGKRLVTDSKLINCRPRSSGLMTRKWSRSVATFHARCQRSEHTPAGATMSTSEPNHTGPTVITLAGHQDLTRETVEAVAWGGERLALAPAALERVAAGQAELAALLAAGTRVYGVGTGTGWLASVDLAPAAREEHQRNLLLGRAVGGPPWLEAAEARALLVTRLGNLVSGHAGVGPELCRFLVDRLNDGFVPAVPRRGVGCAGEVIPLAHAFQTLVGTGLVLQPDGSVRDAGAALAERGALPHRLRAKEGIALLAGSPVAAALALARLRSAERLAGQLLASAAAAVDALAAPLDPYDQAVGRLAGDPLLEGVLADLRRAVGDRQGAAAALQSPVSFRVAPQVLA